MFTNGSLRNAPPIFFSLLHEKKMVRARARRKERQRDEPLYSSVARYRDRRNMVQLRCKVHGNSKHTEPRAGAGRNPSQKYR